MGLRAGRALLITVVAVAVAAPSPEVWARDRKGPTQIVPGQPSGKTRRETRRAEDIDRSEGGTRQGVLELSLGSVVLGGSALLIGRGAWELVEDRKATAECAAELGCAPLDPRRGGKTAAGLSFAFAGVLGLAGGFLLARGVRIRRDYKEWKRNEARLSVAPWAVLPRATGGVAVTLRF